jgi:hypothetical protein
LTSTVPCSNVPWVMVITFPLIMAIMYSVSSMQSVD